MKMRALRKKKKQKHLKLNRKAKQAEEIKESSDYQRQN